jgi:hypothetical protein
VRRQIHCRRHEPAADAAALKLPRHFGVDQDEPAAVAPVGEFGEVAVGRDFETGPGLIVGDRLSITHAGAARSPGRRRNSCSRS